MMTIRDNPNSSQIPLISIITVVYNGAKYLERTIKSVIKQVHKNFEYIIIDGGSTDETINILKRYEHNINKYISEPDNGLYDGMNKGLLIAKGNYVMFLNSDDWLEDGALFDVSNNIMRNPGYDIYHGYFLIHDKTRSKKRGHGILPTSIPAYQPASFVRRTIFDGMKWFDDRYEIAADFKFFKSLQLDGYKFCKLDTIVSNFSIGGASSDINTRLNEMEQILIDLKYSKITTAILMFRMQIVTNNFYIRPIGV
jgi:glycosyltransferase involved in cell wall biosynthesis